MVKGGGYQSVYQSVSLSIGLSVCVCLFFCLSLSVSFVCPSVSVYLCLSVCLCVCVSVCVRLSVPLYICPFVYLPPSSPLLFSLSLSLQKAKKGIVRTVAGRVEMRLLAIPILYVVCRMWGTLQFFYSLGASPHIHNGCVSRDLHIVFLLFGYFQVPTCH